MMTSRSESRNAQSIDRNVCYYPVSLLSAQDPAVMLFPSRPDPFNKANAEQSAAGMWWCGWSGQRVLVLPPTQVSRGQQVWKLTSHLCISLISVAGRSRTANMHRSMEAMRLFATSISSCKTAVVGSIRNGTSRYTVCTMYYGTHASFKSKY